MIEFNCPTCGHTLRVADAYAGKKGGCKHCGARFLVPDKPTSPSTQFSGSTGFDALSGEQVEDANPFTARDHVVPDEPSAGPPAGRISEAAKSFTEDDDEWQDVLEDSHFNAKVRRDYSAPDRPQAVNTGLGCFFWFLVFNLPPAALILAILLPREHKGRTAGLVSALFMSLVMGGVIGGFAYMGTSLDVDFVSEWENFDFAELESAAPRSTPRAAQTMPEAEPAPPPVAPRPAPETAPAPVAETTTAAPPAVVAGPGGLPAYPGVVFSPSRYTSGDIAPFDPLDAKPETYHAGIAKAPADEVATFYADTLKEQGWTAVFRNDSDTQIDLQGRKDGQAVHIALTKGTNATRIVIVSGTPPR